MKSVWIQVSDGVGATVGTGTLIQQGSYWSGSITVSVTGFMTFKASAYDRVDSSGVKLYYGETGRTVTGSGDSVTITTSSTTTSILSDEFNSLNAAIWTTYPSLSPRPGSEGSNIPGECKTENGVLMLSRYAWELEGANAVSAIGTASVTLPGSYLVTTRFHNEFVGFMLGDIVVQIYGSTIYLGHNGMYGDMDGSLAYQGDNTSYYLLTLAKTPAGITIKISKDEPLSLEETFDYTQDLSGISGDSTVAIVGGSNTSSLQYSEIDYFRALRVSEWVNSWSRPGISSSRRAWHRG